MKESLTAYPDLWPEAAPARYALSPRRRNMLISALASTMRASHVDIGQVVLALDASRTLLQRNPAVHAAYRARLLRDDGTSHATLTLLRRSISALHLDVVRIESALSSRATFKGDARRVLGEFVQSIVLEKRLATQRRVEESVAARASRAAVRRKAWHEKQLRKDAREQTRRQLDMLEDACCEKQLSEEERERTRRQLLEAEEADQRAKSLLANVDAAKKT